MKHDSTENYIRNRSVTKSSQISLWINRRESGLMRLIERLLVGANISDRLGGDGSTIKQLSEIKNQFVGSWSTDRLQENELFIDDGIILSDVNVEIRSGLIRLNNGYILNDFLAHWQSLIYGGGLASEYKSARKADTYLTGEWTSVSSTPYYYHFLIEDLARIARIREEFPKIKIAMLGNQEKWKHELLRYFDFDYQVIEFNTVKFERYVTSKGGEHQNIFGIELLRSKIHVNPPQSENSKILVTRKGLARENIELEELIRENLTQRGYKVLIPELMTVEQQIKEFSEASTVVGVHGGALANSIWSRRGTKVIEIQSHPYKTKDFEFLANKLRLEYNVMNFGQINEESKIEISKIE
jgi:hypothetical protein